ncbi:hypothetical protein EK21DRAFT_108669 [Setomelanomma holmii]|uniref:Uncharacterized protein n=1 Tax=Setomelanomma holmii TaxID=210430 RepID=A0A9P4HHX2_9PLEO|nr:hypothetical protein EK21DRAFT_108669 [Setomelanomma holmii]
MPIFTRKIAKLLKRTATPEQNRINSPFLRLPGEIRNLIYSYGIYSRLEVVTISHETKAQHFGKTVLSLALFRVSHQIRGEALSYLVANKCIKICGIDCANAFFDCIEPALTSIKRLVIAQPSMYMKPVPRELVELFLYFLDQCSKLESLAWEMGMVGFPHDWEVYESWEDKLLFDQVITFMENHQQIKVWFWGMGSYDSKTPAFGSITGPGRLGSEVARQDKDAGVMYWF